MHLHIFCAIISISTADDGDCGRAQQTENSGCCASFYRDQRTKECLPCIGSYGVNCSFQCPEGYFGFGCSQLCICNDTENCDPKAGCIHNVVHNGGESVIPGLGFTMETKYIYLVISSFVYLQYLLDTYFIALEDEDYRVSNTN